MRSGGYRERAIMPERVDFVNLVDTTLITPNFPPFSQSTDKTMAG